MNFIDTDFLYVFLPLTLVGAWGLMRCSGRTVAMTFVTLVSLIFYWMSGSSHLPLLVASILLNYCLGILLLKHTDRRLLWLGILANLGCLFAFKYLGFFQDNVRLVLGIEISVPDLLLPLAISFFTFQQIAFLADVYSGRVRSFRFRDYAFFVAFFPQLIAGPIVRFGQITNQLSKRDLFNLVPKYAVLGGVVFLIGLYKKVVFADGISIYADHVYDNVTPSMMFVEAWVGTLAYGLQIYFDFSGYSDMAIGLALIFGIRLPANFRSPYRAASIIDFWKRWHITLSLFLRDYLYFPLGGGRLGRLRQSINIMIVMLLSGLWHGAAWTFVLWGGLHGAMLVINHAWRQLIVALNLEHWTSRKSYRFSMWTITFLAVTFAWSLFRAESWSDALHVIRGLTGLNGFGSVLSGDLPIAAAPGGQITLTAVLSVFGLLLVVWFGPRTVTISRVMFGLISRRARTYRRLLAAYGPRGEAFLGTMPYFLVLSGISIICTVTLIALNRDAQELPFIYMVF